MRAAAIVVVLLGMAASEAGATTDQVRWPYPPPRPVILPPAPLPPLTEAEWSRWLLRADRQEQHCGRITFISGMVAAAGLSLMVQRDPTPSPEALAAGRTGKLETFTFALGAASLAGGGMTFLTASRCASQAHALVQQLEREGQRRGFGPPRPEPLSEREWIVRLTNARGQASFARQVVIGGSVVMLAGAYAMDRYQPPPDQRGLARLGPGVAVFFIGLGATVGGTVAWAHGAADVRALESQGPPPKVTWRIVPKRSGIAARVVVAF